MREKTCCFTGHRDVPEGEKERLYRDLNTEISALIKKGVNIFRCGGARGFDTMAALAVLDIKKLNPKVSLVVDVPCSNQHLRWRAEERETMEYIMSVADEVNILSPHYYNGCMQYRNRYMADRSLYLIAYQTKAFGGSAYTVLYAKEQGLTIIKI
ncbi:MAG: DUF1273 family protein [Clostridia bacterium]|nr:DUF1273 family protein [Clostridia bacterium]